VLPLSLRTRCRCAAGRNKGVGEWVSVGGGGSRLSTARTSALPTSEIFEAKSIPSSHAWPDISGRRHLRAEVERLSETVKNLQDTTKATAIELSEAMKDLQDTTKATTIEMSEDVTNLRDTLLKVPSKTHTIALTVTCVLAILLGSLSTTTGLRSFSNPVAIGGPQSGIGSSRAARRPSSQPGYWWQPECAST